jgi:hypothetical protein
MLLNADCDGVLVLLLLLFQTLYPIMKNNLGAGARDHALEEHTELKKMLVKLDGMHLENSDGSINRDYVNGFAEVLKVRSEWVVWIVTASEHWLGYC